MSFLEKLFQDDGICKPSRIICCLDCTEATYSFCMYLIGPFFVLCALTIVASVSYVGFFVLLPIREEVFSPKWWIIVIVGLYFLFNIMFHYVLCVFSNPGTHRSKYFDRAVQDAMDQGITLLYEDPNKDKAKDPLFAKYKSWMSLSPFEWGYCKQTNGPKPPRSHYDQVTQNLVMNMDHYCPWMFNCIGYGNYRYFISFMLHVIFATWYVSYLAAGMFFQSRDGPQFYDIEDKRTYVAFTFLVCSAISCPVFLLAAYHLYLVFSAQTTIEFWGNCQLPDRFKKGFTTPYSRGCKRNWRRVFGDLNPLLAVLVPSSRPPPWPPWPQPASDSTDHTGTHVV